MPPHHLRCNSGYRTIYQAGRRHAIEVYREGERESRGELGVSEVAGLLGVSEKCGDIVDLERVLPRQMRDTRAASPVKVPAGRRNAAMDGSSRASAACATIKRSHVS